MDPLSQAAAAGDEAELRRLLDAGGGEVDRALWACMDAPPEARMKIAKLLLDAGASPRRAGANKVTALHRAAASGPLALVELLIRRGAVWQTDEEGKSALDHARAGHAPDKAAIVELLDRPVIRDPRFREAVRLMDMGDLIGFTRHLDEHPNLLRENAIEPDCYPRDYFRDPRLFWFIAENPARPTRIASNIVEFARAMIRRRVDQADLDYALELVMSSSAARERGTQVPLVKLLVEAGATATPRAIQVALAHWELSAVEALLAGGLPMTAPIAAAFGRTDDLARLLPAASSEERQAAFGLAVVNRQGAAARLCLDAGADVNAFLPVHKHSTALHQAVLHNDVSLMTLLIEYGARTDIKDTLWDGTPLAWALYTKKPAAEAYLRGLVL